jgi:KDO2-lipid IV(A) lauroyltransferase
MRSDPFSRIISSVIRVAMRITKWIGRDRTEKAALALCRLVGPLFKENRTAAGNIAAAFPEKSDEERQRILRGCWENFARVIVEFVFLEDLAAGFDPTSPDQGKITVSGVDQFLALRDDGKPAVIFAAHLANWEVLGVVAAKFGLSSVIPFRAPGNIHLAKDVLSTREELMGRLVANSRGAAFEIAAALDGGAHLGMLVDQRLSQGLTVPFFGRPAKTNPLAAKFARQFDCPVHGARAIRLPGGRFHLELTPEIDLERDQDGLIDVAAATAKINQIVEVWVREHPEQYFWLHDRWKM